MFNSEFMLNLLKFCDSNSMELCDLVVESASALHAKLRVGSDQVRLTLSISPIICLVQFIYKNKGQMLKMIGIGGTVFYSLSPYIYVIAKS